MRLRRKVGELLEMPVEITSDLPKITISGFEEVMIENFIGILDYEEFFIRIKTYIGNVIINGFNMKLNQLNSEDIMIQGMISNISFEKGETEDSWDY